MKNIDKNIIYLGWVSFFTDFSSSIITTLLPIYIVYVLNEGVDKLGYVIAVATFVSYFFRIVFGYLSDRLALVKPLVVTGYFISAFTKPLLALTYNYQGIIFVRSAERLGKAIRSAPKDALISAYSQPEKTGRTFGFHKTMDIAGELCGATSIFLLLLWVTVDKDSIRLIFASTIIPGLIATVIATVFVQDIQATVAVKKKVVFDPLDRQLLPLIMIFFVSLFFMLSDQFLIIKAKEAGYSLSIIPLFVIAFTLTQTLASYYSGIISDRFGSRKMLFISFVFGFLSIITLWQNYIWLSFILLGLFTVISLNTMRSYISQYARSKAFIFGIFYGGIALSGSLGAIVVGQLWSRLDFSAVMFFSLSGMGGLTMILGYWLWKEQI